MTDEITKIVEIIHEANAVECDCSPSAIGFGHMPNCRIVPLRKALFACARKVNGHE